MSVEQGTKEGLPWNIVSRHDTFERADLDRQRLSEDPLLQVKIHYQGRTGNKYFAVKTRIHPEFQEQQKRESKNKKRKKKKSSW